MSDCSTKAMMLKERRTCGTCKHVNDVRLGCMFAANDSSYYMRCTAPHLRACGHYVDDPDSLPRRYERLAQVARELYDAAWCAWWLKANEQMPETSRELKDRVADSYLQVEKEQLEALGVSVDD